LEGSTIGILVVDDYEPWRRFVSTTLHKHPELHVIGEALDGLEAIRKAQQLQPELILLDIGLPSLNGIKAARRIRELSPKSKILFISENRSWDIAEEALHMGAAGYVVKSDAAGELLPAVEAVLRGKRYVSACLAGHDLNERTDERTVDHPHREKVFRRLLPRNATTAHSHEVAFYSDDASFVDGFARFVESALQAGRVVIVVTTESHRVSLLHRLQADGVDVSAAVERGHYIQLDVPDTHSLLQFAKVVNDLLVEASKAAGGEHPRVAAG
jgi:DNA-binding NarL/FixJ family response regulator